MKNTLILAALISLFNVSVFAQEGIDVFGIDENASIEQLKEDASSGFDTPGPLAIPEPAYEEGLSEDGESWSPEVPEVPEPTPVEEE